MTVVDPNPSIMTGGVWRECGYYFCMTVRRPRKSVFIRISSILSNRPNGKILKQTV